MSSGWFSACNWCDSGSYQLTAGAGEALIWLMSLVPGSCVSAASIEFRSPWLWHVDRWY
jgi:hypothetical protein